MTAVTGSIKLRELNTSQLSVSDRKTIFELSNVFKKELADAI